MRSVCILFCIFCFTASNGLDCRENQFRCSDGYLCISTTWTCDGYVDCYDASDESDCASTSTPATILSTRPPQPPLPTGTDGNAPVTSFLANRSSQVQNFSISVLTEATTRTSTTTSTTTSNDTPTSATTWTSTSSKTTNLQPPPSSSSSSSSSQLTLANTRSTNNAVAHNSTSTLDPRTRVTSEHFGAHATSDDLAFDSSTSTRNNTSIGSPSSSLKSSTASATATLNSITTSNGSPPTPSSFSSSSSSSSSSSTSSSSSSSSTISTESATGLAVVATQSSPLAIDPTAGRGSSTRTTPSDLSGARATPDDLSSVSVETSTTAVHSSSGPGTPPPTRTEFLCSLRNVTRCRNGVECVPRSYVCDGVEDCSDGSDEEECADACSEPGEIECPDGRCRRSSLLCQGVQSCYRNAVPEFCSNATYSPPPRDDLDQSPFVPKRACTPGREFTCPDLNCIPTSWICDGVDDCFDGSDEVQCQHGKCPKGHVTCGNTSTCIGAWQVCNRFTDCPDGTDEMNCTYRPFSDVVFRLTASVMYWMVRRVCRADEFTCSDNDNRGCLPSSWRCDGVKDCKSGEDEESCVSSVAESVCDKSSSKRDVFRCFNGSDITRHPTCINLAFRCDWARDCPDGSDEIGCYCDEGMTKVRCSSFRCFPLGGWCDGTRDCHDGSDEDYCDKVECPENSFRCKSLGRCLPSEYLCNRLVECPGGLDEENCPCPSDRGFRCEATGKCLEFGRFCDGRTDCPGGSDEPENCSKGQCAPNTFRCLSSGECVHPRSVCDSVADCRDGSDEFSCPETDAED